MIRWRMDDLMAQYEEKTGQKLQTMELVYKAGLSTSTAYLVTKEMPKRIGLQSIDSLLTFFSQHLGELKTSDLIDFEFETQPDS